MGYLIQQNSTTTPLQFVMVAGSDHTTPLYGASPVVAINKNGGGWIAPSGAISELSISAPTFPGAIFTGAVNSGGHLAANTGYFYEITAVNAAGETTISAEQSYTTPNNGVAVNQITINWNAVAGATGYKIYRGTSSGAEQFLANVSSGSTTSFTDTVATAAGNPPLINTTSAGVYQVAANGTDTNTAGPLQLFATALNGDPINETFRVVAFAIDSVSPQVTVATNNDKSGYGLSSAAIAAIQSGLATSSGQSSLAAVLGTPAGASVSADIASVKSDTTKIGGNSGDSPNEQAAQSIIAHVNTMLTASGSNFAFTADALKNAPTGGGSGSGSGPIPINQNTGGSDNLRYVDSSGNGILGASILIYLSTDWPGNPMNILAVSSTGPDGRWLTPAFVDHGTYVAVFTKLGADGPDVSGPFTV